MNSRKRTSDSSLAAKPLAPGEAERRPNGVGDPAAADPVAGGAVVSGAVAGDPVAGGPEAGDSVAGGSVAGGLVADGTEAGGSVTGGSVSGGSEAGGSPAGGSAAGGPGAADPVATDPAAPSEAAGTRPKFPGLRALVRPPSRPPWRQLGLAAGLGLLAAAGQAPLGWWWLTLAALAALFALIAHARHRRAAFWLGWFGGAGHFAAALFWIIEPFLVDTARHGWMAPFALLGLAFGLALFWAVAGALGHWLGRSKATRASAFAVSLAALELARGHVLTGFPWATLGHVWLDTPVAQLAALMGASGLTFATFALAALCAAAAFARHWRAAGGVLAVLLFLVGGWQWGKARLDAPMPQPENPVQIRIVQPNAPQHLKWHPDWALEFFHRQLAQTAAPAETPPDLILWSETAIPWSLENAGEALAMIAQAAGGTPTALGVQRSEAGRYFNALTLLDAGGQPVGIYDKHHLVPFGEYVPLAGSLLGTGYAGLASQALMGFSPGPGPQLLDMGAAGAVLPLICYEAVFPRHLRATPRPDWVFQATNDAWFGQISGPYQHLAQARFRAVEMGLPLVRAANTGVSAIIDPRGRITASLGLDVAGHLDGPLPAALPPTLFARTGEAPLALLLAFLLAALGAARLRPRRRQ